MWICVSLSVRLSVFLLIPGTEFTGGDVSRCGQLRDQDGLSRFPSYLGGFLSDPLLYGVKVWLLWRLRFRRFFFNGPF